jgi:ATP-dependent Lhr-like helicase
LDGGALFFRQLADRAATLLLANGEPAPADPDVVAALWELTWAGVATNDTLAPLRALVGGKGAAHKPRRTPPRGRYARLRAPELPGRTALPGSVSLPSRTALPSRLGPPAAAGRWSLAPHREPDPTRRAHARAEAFLERHGILTRGALDTERITGGFSGIYRVLRAMEESGQVIRGYVVEGLGAAQFAARGAVDRLRALSTASGAAVESGAVVLAAADPAQPYGAALSWPAVTGDAKHRPGRKAGALVVLSNGEPALYVERGGRSLLSFTEDEPALRAAAAALVRAVHDGWLGQLAVQRADGAPANTSPLTEVLTEAGFRITPKGLRLRA